MTDGNNNHVSSQIKNGGVISYFTVALNIVLGLIYTPWILHEVGSSNYGLYTLASSLIAILLLDFGLSSTITRFLANYRAENKQNEIASFIGISIKIYLVISLIITLFLLLVYFNIDNIYKKLNSEELRVFNIVFIITSVFLVLCFPVNLCNGILNAYERYIELKLTDVVNKIGTVIITVAALLFHGGIYSLVFINGFLNFIAFIVKIYIIRYKVPVNVSFRYNENIKFMEIFAFSAWSAVGTISNQMIFNIIPSILGMVANTYAITLYGFANVIEGYVYNITQAINGLFLPSVSRLVVNSQTAEDTLPLMIKVGRINQYIISLLLIGLVVLGKDFIHLWVGDHYLDLYYCSILLSCPYFISSSQQIANSCIIVLNKVKAVALINFFTGIFNLIACYYIAQMYGVIGVCFIISITFLIRIILLNILYSVKLKINTVLFFKKCHLSILPSILISLSLSFLISNLFPVVNNYYIEWFMFFIKVIFICFIYFVCIWFFSCNQYEKKLFFDMIQNNLFHMTNRIK